MVGVEVRVVSMYTGISGDNIEDSMILGWITLGSTKPLDVCGFEGEANSKVN